MWKAQLRHRTWMVLALSEAVPALTLNWLLVLGRYSISNSIDPIPQWRRSRTEDPDLDQLSRESPLCMNEGFPLILGNYPMNVHSIQLKYHWMNWNAERSALNNCPLLSSPIPHWCQWRLVHSKMMLMANPMARIRTALNTSPNSDELE